MKLIYKFDPLQHHGWFVISEDDLKNYPQHYFPFELFSHSKVIFPNKDLSFEICLPSNINYEKQLRDLIISLNQKINMNNYPRTFHELKSFLSQAMMLPPLYVQFRDKKGVYKKLSFELAKKDFTHTEWDVMNKISTLRLKWDFKSNFIVNYLSKFQSSLIFKKIFRRFIVPKVSKDTSEFLSNVIYPDLLLLMKSMLKKL